MEFQWSDFYYKPAFAGFRGLLIMTKKREFSLFKSLLTNAFVHLNLYLNNRNSDYSSIGLKILLYWKVE